MGNRYGANVVADGIAGVPVVQHVQPLACVLVFAFSKNSTVKMMGPRHLSLQAYQ